VSKNCSFILTTNDLGKISGALKSRCLALEFSFPPEEIHLLKQQFAARLNHIMDKEQVTCKPELLAEIIAAGFPDFRQILKQVQIECGG
jgi:DNA polymerase III delta prime subunit